MKPKLHSYLGLLAVTLAPQLASGQVIINDNFSSYANDAALTATWARIVGTSTTITLANDPDASPTRGQGVNQTAAAGRVQEGFSGVTPTDANPLVFSFDLFDANGGATSGRVYAEVRNSGTTTGLFDAGIYNTVNTGTYSQSAYQARDIDSGAWIQLATARSVGWHTFEFDIRANTVDLKIDGVIDANFSNLSWSGGISYNLINLGSGLSGNTGANFDNVYVAVAPVPEPATTAMIGLGGLAAGIAVLRRRKK